MQVADLTNCTIQINAAMAEHDGKEHDELSASN